MFLAGTIQTLRELDLPNIEVLNFSSMSMQYPRLQLYPPYEFGARSDYEFDMKYAQFLLGDENAFIDFIRIPYSIYMGNSVYLLMDLSEAFEMINESILKFLQQRYGLNATLVYDINDVMLAGDTYFNELGLINFQHDKERLAQDLEKARLAAGGIVGVV